jgi:hypothetical protein
LLYIFRIGRCAVSTVRVSVCVDPDTDSGVVTAPEPAVASAADTSGSTSDEAQLAALMAGDNEGARDGVARSMKCIDCGMLAPWCS